MFGVPHGDVKVITNGGNVGTGTPGTVVAEGTPPNFGSAVELISAANNTQESWGISVMAFEAGASATANQAAIDILVGGATDDTLISSLLIGGSHAASPRCYYFPVAVPSGIRVAARMASATAVTASVLVKLYGGCTPPHKVGRKVFTYGTKINDSRGLAVTPSESGAAASVTEMTSSSSEDHFYLLPGLQVAVDITIANATTINVGIGLGASTEERIDTWWLTKDAAEHQTMVPMIGCWRHVPAATRLTLLASNGSTNDTNHDGHIYAVS